MRRGLRAVVALSALVLLLSASLFRPPFHVWHVRFKSRMVTLKATVTNFAVVVNPHAQIHFDVQDDKGVTEKWMCRQCPSPSRHKVQCRLESGDSLKAGDQITIVGDQARDGSNSMRLDHVVLP